MSAEPQERIAMGLERLVKVLGAMYASNLTELDMGAKAERLRRCGFSNADIADLLGTTANSINVLRHYNKYKRNGKRRVNNRKS